MPVEMNAERSSVSLDFPPAEKKEESQASPDPAAPSSGDGMEKKAAEATLQSNLWGLKSYMPNLEEKRKAAAGYISAAQKACTENVSGYLNEEMLTSVLVSVLDYVVDGHCVGQYVPETFSKSLDSLKAEPILTLRNRHLRECRGDQIAATKAAVDQSHSCTRSFQVYALGAIPVVGGAGSYMLTVWYQLREIALIAAIHGHDIHDPQVKMKMLCALVGGNLLKVPAATINLIAREVVKKIVIQAGVTAVSSAIPVDAIYNYFTDNAGKVSTHAKAFFAGENSKPVPAKEYTDIDSTIGICLRKKI